MDVGFSEYLQELVNQLPSRAALIALGYSGNSYNALQTLATLYDVEIPKRKNQYSGSAADCSYDKYVPRRGTLGKAKREGVPVEHCVVFGDVHGTHVDYRSFAVLLAVLNDIQPEHIIINGDFVDFEAISRFSKDPKVGLSLDDELSVANSLLDAIQEAAPNAKVVYVEGNHEVRMREYLRKAAPSLLYLTGTDGERLLSVESLLHLDERGVEYVRQIGKSGYTRYGSITVGHFDKYSAVPGSVAKWFLEHRNESVIQAHTHKRCMLDRRFPDGREITCIEHGHLMDPEPEYVTDPDWGQGFVVITKRVDTDRFHAELVRIIDHECLYNGILYSG